MNNPFDQKIFNNFDTPIQKLMELNAKMMQNLTHMKPIDLVSVKKPEELLEKQIELFAQNSQMMLDYMRSSFSILENHWLNMSHTFGQNQQQVVNEVSSAVEKNVKKAAAAVKSAVNTKKSVSAPKKAGAKNTVAADSNKNAKPTQASKVAAPKVVKKQIKKAMPIQDKANNSPAKEAKTPELVNVNHAPEKSSAPN